MKQWGLAVISMGGVLIVSSALVESPYTLIVAGLSLIVGGVVMFRRGKGSE